MKELNTFRKFLVENIASDQIVFSSRFRDEREGLEVILYVIAKSEEEATQMANQYMDENYIDSYKFERTQPLGATFGDLDPGEQELFKGNIADFGVDTFMEGNEIHEGTWGYGSDDQMKKALSKLEKIRKMGGVKGSLELDKIGSMLYNTFGDDEFHNAIDRAKDGAIDDDTFANAIGDAQARGIEMLNNIHRNRALQGRINKIAGVDEGEELKENDSVLDEVIEEGTLSDEINNNMKLIAVHMSAAETLEDIVAEFNIIQGGKEILAQVLRNIVKDNKLTGDPEEYASIGFEE